MSDHLCINLYNIKCKATTIFNFYKIYFIYYIEIFGSIAIGKKKNISRYSKDKNKVVTYG